MIKDFFDGITSYFKAFGFIARNRLWYYVLMPGLISLILGGSIAYSAFVVSDEMSFYVGELYPSSWRGFWIVEKLSYVLTWLLLGVGSLMAYRVLLVALVSPFMSPLAARVQSEMTGKVVYDPPFFSFTNFRLILRGGYLSLRNLLKEIWYTGWLLLLGLIPVFGLAAIFFIFIIQAFYAGFSNLDYTLEKYFDVKGSKRFSEQYRWLAVGNGVMFLALLTVPVLGLFFAPALSTVAATLEAVKRVDAPVRTQHELEEFI